MNKTKIFPLHQGERIGVIAPGSPVGIQAEIDRAIQGLREWGYEPVLGETVKVGEGDLAGTDAVRCSDIERMWLDPSIRGVWGLRGGYGCLRLLSKLNYDIFRKNSKLLVGFSDITALEIGLWTRADLISFHGPVLTSLFTDFTSRHVCRIIAGEVGTHPLEWPEGKIAQMVPIRPGKARGVLLGGNLSTLVSLLGTGYFPDLRGVILFIEEIGEAAYRIDRMLTQLQLSGVLDAVAAIIIGQSVPVVGQTEADLIRVFTERISGLKCPSAYGFPIGHLADQWTLPQGVWSEVDTASGELVVLESPFYG